MSTSNTNHEYATLLNRYKSVINCFHLFVFPQAVDFLSQVLDSPEKDAVKDAVRTLQDIGRFDP